MDKASPRKVLRKKRSKNSSKAIVSDDSDTEIQEYSNIEPLDDVSLPGDDVEGWNSDDDHELVEKVKSLSKNTDKVSYKTRLKQLNWKEIAFKSYSADDCEKRFQNHLKHVRRHRNLSEIATDIEANINKCPLKKPLNPYQLFIQDQLSNVRSSGAFSETMKNLATIYKELSPEEKVKYERKSEQLRQQYKLDKEELQSGIIRSNKAPSQSTNKIKTPFILYAESRKSEETEYSKLRESYTDMSIDEKYKWVIKAVNEAQELSEEKDVSKFLNKEEQRIFKGQVKSTPSAYCLYVKEKYNEIKDSLDGDTTKNVFTEIALRWKRLDSKKKKTYTNAAALLKQKALGEQDAFNERHGVTPKKVKRRKSIFTGKPPQVSDDDEEEEVGTPNPKKRKVSVSSNIESGSDEKNTKLIRIKLPTKRKTNGISAGPSPIKATQSPIKTTQSPIKATQSPIKATQSPLKVAQSSLELVADKAKKRLYSESSVASEHETANSKSESDAAVSSGSTSSKKKSKKEKKSKIIEPPGDKPPSTLFAYFAANVHTGKPHKAQKSFNKLIKKERKQLNSEYNEKVEAYVTQLKKYLASLSKEDAIAYISKVKAAEDAEKDGNDAGNESSQEY